MTRRDDEPEGPEAESEAESEAEAKSESEKKPRKRTRRRILQGAGGLIGAGALTGVGLAIYDQRQRFGRDAERTIADHRVSLPASPQMIIANGKDPTRNMKAAIERLGGIERLIDPSDVVLIKPNMGWNRNVSQGANTHPAVVAELVRACKRARAKRVMVSDCPVKEARSAFTRSGILKAASEAGAEVILPEESRYHNVKLSDRLGTWEVLEPFVIATKIINVPVVKHNALSVVTGGMKNWIGITSFRRVSFHADIDRAIAELSALMRPTLTVIDATRVLMANGPQGGNLADVKQQGTVAVSLDPVAVDAWAAELLGHDPNDLPGFLRLGEEMGLGKVDYRSLQPVELTTG